MVLRTTKKKQTYRQSCTIHNFLWNTFFFSLNIIKYSQHKSIFLQAQPTNRSVTPPRIIYQGHCSTYIHFWLKLSRVSRRKIVRKTYYDNYDIKPGQRFWCVTGMGRRLNAANRTEVVSGRMPWLARGPLVSETSKPKPDVINSCLIAGFLNMCLGVWGRNFIFFHIKSIKKGQK